MRALEQHRHSGHLRKRLHHLRRLGKSLDTGLAVQQRRQHGVPKGLLTVV